ncbi:hypothetical protein C0991_007434, partial [Blastosporella zonata]
MNTINTSTVTPESRPTLDHDAIHSLIKSMETDFLDAMDSLTAAKLIQAYYANLEQTPKIPYK